MKHKDLRSQPEATTPPHGDLMADAALRAQRGTGKEEGPSSTGSDEPEKAPYSDPLPARSHSLDPSVSSEEESREQAPPSPSWLEGEREEGRK
jgi:hypothetical protein